MRNVVLAATAAGLLLTAGLAPAAEPLPKPIAHEVTDDAKAEALRGQFRALGIPAPVGPILLIEIPRSGVVFFAIFDGGGQCLMVGRVPVAAVRAFLDRGA